MSLLYHTFVNKSRRMPCISYDASPTAIWCFSLRSKWCCATSCRNDAMFALMCPQAHIIRRSRHHWLQPSSFAEGKHHWKKTKSRVTWSFFLQRNRDSNPNIQSQSLLCYRYTIPLSLFSLISISQRMTFVKGVFKIYFAFFSFFVFQYEDLNKIERFSPYFPWHQSHFPLNIPRFSRNSLLLRWFSL